jgi:uncharacterized delta-60 repeat protein
MAAHTTSLALLAFVCALGRVATAAHLDPGFGTGGKVTTEFDGFTDFALSVLVEPDGGIIAAGLASASPFCCSRFALVRYLADGTLDASYGTGGKVTTPILDESTIVDIVRQADGMVVAAGWTGAGLIQDLAVARYDISGNLDPGFGTDGITLLDTGIVEVALAVGLQSDGKIVVAGQARSGLSSNDGDYLLARFDTDGVLDPTFGSGGTVVSDFGTPSFAQEMVVQPDDSLIVAGTVLARYDADGTLDAAFGTGGSVPLDESDGLVRQPDGKLVVSSALPAGFGYALRRFNADGSLDTGFGSGGTASLAFGMDRVLPLTLALQADGSLVVAGEASVGAKSHYASVRFTPAGAVDPTYAACGVLLTSFDDVAGRGSGASAAVVQPDGKIVVAGDANEDFGLARYTTTPVTPCTAASAGKSALCLRTTNPQKPNLAWKWLSSGPVAKSDFGDPTADTDLVFCLRDGEPDVAFQIAAVVPADHGLCGTTPCWRENTRGFAYRDRGRPGLADGVSKMSLATGVGGPARISLKGSGPNLGVPLPPYVVPLTARLARTDGTACWDATFSTTTANGPGGIRARSD